MEPRGNPWQAPHPGRGSRPSFLRTLLAATFGALASMQRHSKRLARNGRELYRERITGRESTTKVQPGCTTGARVGAVSQCCAQKMILANRHHRTRAVISKTALPSSVPGACPRQKLMPSEACSALVFRRICLAKIFGEMARQPKACSYNVGKAAETHY